MKTSFEHDKSPIIPHGFGVYRIFLILMFSTLVILSFVSSIQLILTDQKKLLFSEMPGLKSSQSTLLYGQQTYNQDFPQEIAPPKEALEIIEAPVVEKSTISPPPNNSNTIQQQVFIYHSHNRESWLPELKNEKDPDMAYHATKNVTLLGDRLEKLLQKSGIGVIHSTVDYPSKVTAFKYARSYDYSKKTIQTALKQNPDVKYWFDIHRDSQRRSKTTIRIKGTDYAQIYFVIGEKNPNWQKNLQFARELHTNLNEMYPGISKGIYNKNIVGSNSEYNQSHSPNSSLIEVGGVDNTLEEAYRSTDILSEAIVDLIQKQGNITTAENQKSNKRS